MPELPEVETLRNSIQAKIVNKTILAITKNRENLRYLLPSFDVAQGAIIQSCERRAKYLLLRLSNQQTIIIHLGMSGQLLIHTDDLQNHKHDHVVFKLSDITLIYRDPRRFGMIDILPTNKLDQHKYFVSLGPEPLGNSFNATYLQNAITKRTSAIKQVIMDNHIVVGVGNIYASESLFKAKIHPYAIANQLTVIQLEKLVIAIKDTLSAAITAGGSSIKDFVDSNNNSGYFQQELAVYGKQALPCIKCSTSLEKITQGGRATFFCPQCQAIT